MAVLGPAAVAVAKPLAPPKVCQAVQAVGVSVPDMLPLLPKFAVIAVLPLTDQRLFRFSVCVVPTVLIQFEVFASAVNPPEYVALPLVGICAAVV